MAFNYDRAKATADRLIANFGKEIIIRQKAPATGDPWNPQTGTPTDESVRGVELKTSLFFRAQEYLTGDDLRLLIQSPPSGAPGLSDTILIDGVEHRIVESMPFQPADVLIYVELVIRK